MNSEEILLDKSAVEAQRKSREELMRELKIDKIPTVSDIIEYLENKATIHPVGKMSIDVYSVNKEALRLAAVYLRDAYCGR